MLLRKVMVSYIVYEAIYELVNLNQNIFFSGSHDQSAMLWVWNVARNSVDCVVTCRGHDKGVECLAVSADASRFVTCSWDNNICLWSASK